MDFSNWKAACNHILISNIGLGIDDLPDALWRDYYEEKFTPQQAIDCAIEDVWWDDPALVRLFKR